MLNQKTENTEKIQKSKTLIGGAGQYQQRSFQYNYVYTLGTKGLRTMLSRNTQFKHPHGVAVSAADNRIYVAERANHRVQVYDAATRNYIGTLGTTGSAGARNTQFNEPISVAVSATDNLIYVADNSNDRVQVFYKIELPPSYTILNNGYPHNGTRYYKNTPSPKYVQYLNENTAALRRH